MSSIIQQLYDNKEETLVGALEKSRRRIIDRYE